MYDEGEVPVIAVSSKFASNNSATGLEHASLLT